MPAVLQKQNFKISFDVLNAKKEDSQTRFRQVSGSSIEHMHNDHSEVRVATFYGPHGIYDTEANINDLETDGYNVVWGWKVFFEF